MTMKTSHIFSTLGAISALSAPTLGLASAETTAKSNDEPTKASGQISYSTSSAGSFVLSDVSLEFGRNRSARAISLRRNGREQFTDAEVKLNKLSLYYGRDSASSPSSRFTATLQENRHRFIGVSHEDNGRSNSTVFAAVPITNESSIQGSFRDSRTWRLRCLTDTKAETLSIGGGDSPSGRSVNLDWNNSTTRVNLRWKEHDAPDLRVVSGKIPKSMSSNSGDVKERGINAIESDTFGWPQFSLGNFDLGPGGLPGVYLSEKEGSTAFELKLKPRERMVLSAAMRLGNSGVFEHPYALFQLQDLKGVKGLAFEAGGNLHGSLQLRGRIDLREGTRPLLSVYGAIKF